MGLRMLFFIFVLVESIFAQDKTFQQNDTLFIQREVDSGYYHAIYIDSNPNTKQFKWLTDFSFDEDELNSLKEIHAEKKSSVKKIDVAKMGLPNEYLPLHQFQGKYYLYAPSDWGNTGQMIISDSNLIHVCMDGPSPEFFYSLTKNGTVYTLQSFTPYIVSTDINTVTITCVDQQKGLYLWDARGENEDYRYSLFVDKNKAENFPMIVNYCKTQKQSEFQFDKLDVKKLFKENR